MPYSVMLLHLEVLYIRDHFRAVHIELKKNERSTINIVFYENHMPDLFLISLGIKKTINFVLYENQQDLFN